MLKDLEHSTRHSDHLKKIRKKWTDFDKKYQTTIANMKIASEEAYQKKNSDLQEKLRKKEKLLKSSLENNNKTRMLERQKIIEKMMQKEKLAMDNVANFMEKQEKDRQQFQKDSENKSK